MKPERVTNQRARRHRAKAESPEAYRRARYGTPIHCTAHGAPCLAYARGLCRSAYRKFQQHELPLPPHVVTRSGLTAAEKRRRMRQWVATIPPAARKALAAILAEIIMGTE